jgi:hypothetical protein
LTLTIEDRLRGSNYSCLGRWGGGSPSAVVVNGRDTVTDVKAKAPGVGLAPLPSSETPPVAGPEGLCAPAKGGVLASRLCPVCQKTPGGLLRPVPGRG